MRQTSQKTTQFQSVAIVGSINMNEATNEQDHDERVDELAEEFVRRNRAGDAASIDEYVSNYPELADAIRRYFPLVEAVELAARVGDTVKLQTDVPTVSMRKNDVSKSDEQTDVGSGQTSQQFGRYLLQRQLGRGAMGTVWLAHDSELDRAVALKLPEFEESDKSGAERFRREARSMATVQHSNLCPIYDVGEIDGRPFLTMAFVDGPTLSEFYIQNKDELSGRKIADVVRKLALALEVAHQSDVIHRDVKPTNVMINSSGEPILMDFGLARRNRDGESEITQDGSIVGSPAYMSPEQVDGQSGTVGPQTDVYSLGVILYELLCGRRPFEGTVMSVLGQIMSDDPLRPPSEFQPDIDQHLEAICLKALSRSLADRYGSAAGLARALEGYLDSNTLSDKAVPTQPAPAKSISGKQPLTIAAVLLVSGLVALATFLIRTPHGDVIVKAPEGAEVRVALIQKGEVVKLVGPDENWTVEIGKGRYDLSLKPMPGKDGESISSFALRGNNTLTVDPDTPSEITIEWKPKRQTADSDSEHAVSATVSIDRMQPPERSGTSYLLPAPAVPTAKSEGHFVDSGQRLGNSHGEVVRLADLDGDGDLDAFIGCGVDEADAVWLNDGQGQFTDNGQTLLANSTSGLGIGDVDGDGDFDVIAAGPQRTILWVNDGNARFSASDESFPPGNHAEFGDLDGDKDLDIVVARLDLASHVLLNDGHGHFEDSGQRLGSGSDTFVAIADLDSDEDLDVYLATSDRKQDAVYLNDGTGKFRLTQQQLSSGMTGSVSLVDWNGDGHRDAVLCVMLGSLELWINDGSGTLALAGKSRGAFLYDGLTTGDIDGDGDPDCLSVVSYGARGPACLLTNDENGFAKPQSFFGNQAGGWPALGDLDGDGDLDAFLTSYYDKGPAQVWWNTAPNDSVDKPMFVLSDIVIPAPGTWGAVPADFDQDNDIDLFVPAQLAESALWLNQGNGQFEKSNQKFAQETESGSSAGDLDGDGDLDLYVSSFDRPDQVWLNDGDGQFVGTDQRLGGGHSRFNYLADLDSDGDLDVFVLRQYEKPGIWFNQGNGRFDDRIELPAGPQAAGFGAMGDIDGDGDIDLIVSTYGFRQPLIFYINDGQGQFELRESELQAVNPQGLRITDTNNDGHVDIIAAGSPHESMAIYYGDGTGQFRNSNQLLSGMPVVNIVHADLDDDGDVDLITGGASGAPNQILLHDGKGNFQHEQWLGHHHSSCQVADIDGDGDIDIIESAHEFGCRIWLNQTVK